MAREASSDPAGVRLRILPEGDEYPADLRHRVDLDLGALPELPAAVRSVFPHRDREAAAAASRAGTPGTGNEYGGGEGPSAGPGAGQRGGAGRPATHAAVTDRFAGR